MFGVSCFAAGGLAEIPAQGEGGSGCAIPSVVMKSGFLEGAAGYAPATLGLMQIEAEKSADTRIAYLKKHASPIRSIDAEDGNFSDLESLRTAIGSRRIVMLGESTHGDGATFAAKTRLIKYLHEQMGFDVLAFESGFYETSKAWSMLQSGKDPAPAVATAIDPIWSESRQLGPLWSYLSEHSKTNHPLELAGFDMQFTGSASHDSLLSDLGDYIAHAQLPRAAAGAATGVIFALTLVVNDSNFMWNGSSFKNVPAASRPDILTGARALADALAALRTADEREKLQRDFWTQYLKSAAAFLEMSWRVDAQALEQKILDWALNLRDRQMGDNLIWLAQRAYPKRKIVVWSATSHIIRRRDVFIGRNDPVIPMGEWVDRAIGSEVYVLGFTAYQGRWGEAGASQTTDLPPADPKSLEGLLSFTGFPYAFLDFRNPAGGGEWLREPIVCRLLKNTPITADWPRIADGLFFIREMVPSARIAK
jgi:erythromycin esterase